MTGSDKLEGRAAELTAFLGRHQEIGGWEEEWAGVPLKFRAYVGDEATAREYVGSVRAIVFRGEEVLVADAGGFMELTVGGRPDPGETVEAALVREVAEETGWRTTPGPVVGFIHARRQEGGKMPGPDWRRPDPDFISPVYVAEALEFDATRLEADAKPVRFIPISEALAQLHPLLKLFLERAVAVRAAVDQGGPTPYPDVNEVLRGFLEGARRILGQDFVGMYLYGSLAAGDFSPERSDIDFVVVTEEEVTPEQLALLKEMHDRFVASDSPWAMEIDGSYIPRAALRRYEKERARHPHIERGVGKLRVEQFHADWVIQRHILRECGVVLAGPPAHTLIDPVTPEEIRSAVRSQAVYGWGPVGEAADPAALRQRGGQVYAVLTMCRLLHTLETGEVASKQVAARWALQSLQALDARWRPLIERALAWKKTDSQEPIPGDAEETAALIRLASDRWRAQRAQD